ncbi:hypothetical protein B566_EDAN004296, partial [Ephemera danica]
ETVERESAKKRIKIEWNPSQTVQLIKLFKARPILYDMNHEEYMDKDARHAALKEIRNELKETVPGISSMAVRDKICRIRAQFGELLGKVKESLRDLPANSGNVYVPKWYGYEELSFLQPFIETRQKTRAPTKFLPAGPGYCYKTAELQQHEATSETIKPAEQCWIPEVPIKTEHLSEEETESTPPRNHKRKRGSETLSATKSGVLGPRAKTIKVEASDETSLVSNNTINAMEYYTPTRSLAYDDPDYQFGLYIANTLSSIRNIAVKGELVKQIKRLVLDAKDVDKNAKLQLKK